MNNLLLDSVCYAICQGDFLTQEVNEPELAEKKGLPFFNYDKINYDFLLRDVYVSKKCLWKSVKKAKKAKYVPEEDTDENYYQKLIENYWPHYKFNDSLSTFTMY